MDINLDLKQLRIFVAIFDTGSVGSAARYLNMSQPGLSTALARLRVQLQDPLFIKGSGGMEPTSRSRKLIDPVRAIIRSMETEIIVPPKFDPKTSTREFRITLSDIGEGIYLPLIIRRIEEMAPGLTLQSMYMPPRELEEAMAGGEVDVAAGFFPDIKTSNFFQRRIGLHSFAGIIRAGHPLANSKLTMKQFLALRHVVVETTGRSQEVFERFLQKHSLQRDVVLRTPHFMSVPIIVATTNVIAVVPQALADFISADPSIKQIQLPFTPPTFQVNLYWHRSSHHDAANKWLRDALISEFPMLQRRAYHRNGKPSRQNSQEIAPL
ncbi:LysR family transcriptional regulator [Paralcaligenes sp. KSB-10]|uniref:LysR family transcriptional regulator n=1 Tax=Paralcaligenes sp. KSB-10 TaxID=2901142 RepID=UPI001E3CC361|nr:LysR family transcriptional regulator [Paralcaligenes sp. KSB-10]UHL62711.1 LysR family transcriptional regulator [Paralcaligenes sp. KSB-10]